MVNNGDEGLTTGLKFDGPLGPDVIAIGNFHKTMPHNQFGEVDPAAYETFRLAATTKGDYEGVPRGFMGVVVAPEAGFDPSLVPIPAASDKFNNPQAARVADRLSGVGTDFMMPPAPGVRSKSTAAEMAELQWMALFRDEPFVTLAAHPDYPTALAEIKTHFENAVNANELDGLQLGLDLPRTRGNELDIRTETLFRCGLLGEDKGPIVSQFFLHDIAYGAQFIQQKIRPYVKNVDFLTDHGTWLRAQNSGLDKFGHGYSGDNDFGTEPALEEMVDPRRISNMRDIARFVNKDALHQAYFNAALLCLNWKIPMGPGSPYSTYSRQASFGTFGGPDVLTRVSEVAARALAIVWRQKWEVHRRLRPEAYGGLMQMQKNGFGGTKRDYGLRPDVFNTTASSKLFAKHGNYFLPIAFTAGSPPHPSYGAGHATVAGACVTVLKAWFDGKTNLKDHLMKVKPASPFRGAPPNETPVVISETDKLGVLVAYTKADADQMTVEGELNKIACNVAMGRSMGGVHWRSDNTRSLRLGEQLAAEIMRIESLGYAEKRRPDNSDAYWTFTSFNGDNVKIYNGQVFVNNVAVDPKAGPL